MASTSVKFAGGAAATLEPDDIIRDYRVA